MVKHTLWQYLGSKTRLSPRLHALFPRHRRYVDVFGGTGIVLAKKGQSEEEVYCDLDWYCRNALSVVQSKDGCEEVMRRLKCTGNDRQQYAECRRLLLNTDASDITRAWAFLVCGTIGYTGHPVIRNGWIKPEYQKKRLTWLPEEVSRWHKRLEAVAIENLPWQETVARFDSPDTLFFLDPPYPESVLVNRKDGYYLHTMTVEDHIALLEALENIRGYAVLCSYNHPCFTERLFHWQKFSFPSRNPQQRWRHDQVWRNFDATGHKITTDPEWITARYIEMMGSFETAEVLLKHTGRLLELGGHDHA